MTTEDNIRIARDSDTAFRRVAQCFHRAADTWDFQVFEPREYIAFGDRVAMVASYTARCRSTGRQVSCDWTMLWTIRDGKIVHFQEYTDAAMLRDAAAA